MGKFILKDAFISIDAVELSDRANQVTITSDKDVHDVTTFGATSKEKALGLGDGTISIELFQDFDAASVDATLWPIHSNDEAVEVVVRPKSSAVAADNPEYTMTGILPSYSPVSGSVGEPSTVSAEFQNAAQAGIERAVA